MMGAELVIGAVRDGCRTRDEISEHAGIDYESVGYSIDAAIDARRIVRHRRDDYGMPGSQPTPAQRERVLSAIAEGARTRGEIAAATKIPAGSVCRHLRRLTASGQIFRPDPGCYLLAD